MPLCRRRARRAVGAAAAAALVVGLVAGCTSSSPGSPSTSSSSSPSPSPGVPTASDLPLVQGLDVCSLATEQQVQRAAGQPGTPTSRVLTTVPGYDGLVDQCGFGVSFDSSTFVVSVGLAPVGRRDLAAVPGRATDGIGAAARLSSSAQGTTVTFVKGSTLVQLHAVQNPDGVRRSAQVAAVAREIASVVPADPPESDEETRGTCTRVDPHAVAGVLGAPAGVSRTLLYQDTSAVCSWATGVRHPRTVVVTLYTNRQAGPFLAEQEHTERSHHVPGVPGTAFTIPGEAYVIGSDGQAVSVTGAFPPEVAPGRPLPVTPQLTALLRSAATLMQGG